MKPQEQKNRFIILMAEGKSFNAIAQELNINKSTCSKGKAQLVEDIADLLNRVRTGKVTEAQASKKTTLLSNLLKAYDTVQLQSKIDALEAIIGGGHNG